PLREERDERQPRQVVERADDHDHRPERQRAVHRSLAKSTSVPTTMPARPAAIRLSFIGSPASANTANAALAAAAMVGSRSRCGATSAMKHSGTAKSSDQRAGIRLPAK